VNARQQAGTIKLPVHPAVTLNDASVLSGRR